jgi:hypothetical protein
MIKRMGYEHPDYFNRRRGYGCCYHVAGIPAIPSRHPTKAFATSIVGEQRRKSNVYAVASG